MQQLRRVIFRRHIVGASVLMVTTLAGCVPLSMYYQEGTTVSRMNRDQSNCQVRALRQVPVQNDVDITPAVHVPARQNCVAGGVCTTVPGYVIPAVITVIDVNIGLRTGVAKQCMEDQGYARVSIPPCPSRISKTIPTGATQVFPPLDENSCVIRNRGGTWQIYTPQ